MAIAKPGYDIDRSINVGHGERLASLAGGMALAVAGARRATLGGMVMAFAGGALALRGLSGYCPMYAMLYDRPTGPVAADGPISADADSEAEAALGDDAVLAVEIVPATAGDETYPATAGGDRPAPREAAV